VNKDLYGANIPLPKEVVEYLETCFNHVGNSDANVEGHNRNQELRNTGYVTYQQLGRIKNWFDNYNGPKDAKEYELNGAEYMKNWVNNTLTHLRNQTTSTSDEYEPEYIVEPSQDFQNIEKLNRPSVAHKRTIEKYDSAVTESLKRINQIMKKIIEYDTRTN